QTLLSSDLIKYHRGAMKGVKSENSARCSIKDSLGKSFTVFVPSLDKSKNIPTKSVVRKLTNNFDIVLARPAEHCIKGKKAKATRCKAGIEATAIRINNRIGSVQEANDRDYIFTIVDEVKPDKPKLTGVEFPTFYKLSKK